MLWIAPLCLCNRHHRHHLICKFVYAKHVNFLLSPPNVFYMLLCKTRNERKKFANFFWRWMDVVKWFIAKKMENIQMEKIFFKKKYNMFCKFTKKGEFSIYLQNEKLIFKKKLEKLLKTLLIFYKFISPHLRISIRSIHWNQS